MKIAKIPAVFTAYYIMFSSCSPHITKTNPVIQTDTTKNIIGQTVTVKDAFFTSLAKSYPQYFDSLFNDPDKYNIQVIYTQIDRGRNGLAKLTDHYFNVSNNYFYPASTVKFPTVLLTLQKLNELKIAGLDRNTTMITEAGYSGQSAVYNDPQSPDGRPTIAQYIKKILLVSDNDAFNRLYEFLGQEYINNNLHTMGWDSVQIIHRLNIFLTEDENRHTNPVKFYGANQQLVYEKPLQKSELVYAKRDDKKGIGYYLGDSLVNKPFVFSKKNRLYLSDLHEMMKSIFFPQQVEKRKRFNLAKEDLNFIYKYMSMFPRESKYPGYDSSYGDAYSKFLLWGEGSGVKNGNIRIFHKSGDAYGFLTDVAYIVDFENNIEFMLSATILCNNDGIFNDDKYDYDNLGLPFMKHLGEVIYEYELKRERKHKPDLAALKFTYTE
jgi:hypothetical protein